MLKDDDKITYIFIYYYTMKARYILQQYLKKGCIHIFFFRKEDQKKQ